MIKVTIYQSSEGEILGFAIQGHAGYAESGSDIVCAAVSVLAQNTVNSIEQFTQDGFSADVDEEEGGLYLKMEPGYSKESKLLLDSMVLGLTDIQRSYGKSYIRIAFKEV